MSDVVSFDFENSNEFSNFLQAGNYEGVISSAEITTRVKDDPSKGESYALKVTLFDVPEWGNTTKFVNYPIPEKGVYDEATNELVAGDSKFLFNIFADQLKKMLLVMFKEDVNTLNGLTHEEVCKLLTDKTALFAVHEPQESKAGNLFQKIEVIGS